MNRSIAPQISMPSSINLLEIDSIKLKNGLQVYSLNGCSEPVVNLTIVLKAGKYFQAKEMVAGITMSMLKKGTKNFTANEIAEKLDFLGASLNAQAGLYLVSISLSCLKDKLEDILVILKDILTENDFPQQELDLEKKKQIQNLKINQEKNNFLASVKFNEVIFGEKHPCGYRPTEELISNVSRKDLITHFNEIVKFNDKSYLVLSGDIDKNVIALIDQYLGTIAIKNTFKNVSNPFALATEKEHLKTKKDSVQASLRIGMPLIDVQHADYLDLEILNRVFGGYFGSRLMKNIREDKGYTYGIYSYINPFIGGSYFCIATDVGLQYKENTLNEISKEINRLKTELISKEELQMVKNYHKGRIMKSVDGALRFANVLSTNLSLGLDETRINEQLKAVEEITAERLLSLANKYLNFEDMHKIVVG